MLYRRTVDSGDRSKLLKNFRINMEIWDGKIRRSEDVMEDMPVLPAVDWEERLLFLS